MSNWITDRASESLGSAQQEDSLRKPSNGLSPLNIEGLNAPDDINRYMLDDTLGDNPQYAKPDEQLQSL